MAIMNNRKFNYVCGMEFSSIETEALDGSGTSQPTGG
jgi:hypothetical protein